MTTIQDLRKKYHPLIAPLDMELLFSFILKKRREFILAHPEFGLSKSQYAKIKILFARRINNEPIAYLLGKKEFYGLEFKVDKTTLIPRPETELMVELALEEVHTLLRNKLRNINIIDVGTGSGNIIISLAHQLTSNVPNGHSMSFSGIDISKKALAIAKQNSRVHKLDKKIKFIEGNLLEPILKNKKYILPPTKYIILANLPYLSSEIYASTPKDVKLYEPKSALYSPQSGLAHYIKLLRQIRTLGVICKPPITLFLEISPEQKKLLPTIIKQLLPSAKIFFHKDLSGRWRVCEIKI